MVVGLISASGGVAVGSNSDSGGVPAIIPMTRQRSAPSLYSSYISAVGMTILNVFSQLFPLNGRVLFVLVCR